MTTEQKQQSKWWIYIGILVTIVTILHYSTPTMKWQYHLIFMQSYFIPILLGAFQFGVKGGLGTAIIVSILYFPHIMLQWGGLVETNLMRFLQIALFNVIGYLTGLKAQKEKEEKSRYQITAEQLEKTLQKLKAQSDKIAEMEDQLRQADRLAIVGELTASLAHEVRNPLGSIRGVVDILRDELPLKKQTEDFLKILVQETERLNDVVENYLRFASKATAQKENFDVRDVIRNTDMILRNKATKSQIQISCQLPDEPLTLNGNHGQLQQILMNLMLNAIQAMPRGGDILMKAEICRTGKDPGICILISDEGVGISPSEIRNIFKPFYTTKTEGTGLGLAIVKRIIDQNKWRIEVKRNSKKGMTFSVFIPN